MNMVVVLFWIFYVILPILAVGVIIYQISKRYRKGQSSSQLERDWESMVDHKNGE